MTKEQLTAWRREMRRVRNRESAAASRRKVRDRIDELEDEVAVWKKRYQEVLARLGQATGEDGGSGAGGSGGRAKRKRKSKVKEVAAKGADDNKGDGGDSKVKEMDESKGEVVDV